MRITPLHGHIGHPKVPVRNHRAAPAAHSPNGQIVKPDRFRERLAVLVDATGVRDKKVEPRAVFFAARAAEQ